MKLCGILTFQYAHNYGALLQAYSLKKFLSDNSIQAEIINYANRSSKDMYRLFPQKGKNTIDSLRQGKIFLLRLKQYMLFQEFSKDYLEISIAKPFQDNMRFSNTYESIVVGSDQVWNKNLTHDDDTYFLKHIICKNKVSYGASFGKNEMIGFLNAEEICCLGQFHALSVRESDAIPDLEAIVGKKISCVTDPVFLLSHEEWIPLERKPKSVKNQFIFLMTLKQDTFLIEKCKKLEKETGLKTISIHPMGWKQQYGRQLYDVGPLEFLWLIDHAEYVVTNSFHAAAFSVLMEKKLVAGRIENSNNRISSLLDLINKMENQIGVIDTAQCSRSLLKNRISFSKEFLLSNLKRRM